MDKKTEILKNLIKGFPANTVEEAIGYINNNPCVFSLETIDILINEILNLYKSDMPSLDIFYQYQIIINAIIKNRNFQTIYNPNEKVTSLLEMLRILSLIFGPDIDKYLSGCLDVVIGVVEVNKKGLKIKHFAYVTEYEVEDLVYIGKPHPANFYKVSDYYQTDLKSLLPYIVHLSADYVNKCDLNFKEITKNNLKEVKQEWVVTVLVDGVEGYYKTSFETYFLQEVEVRREDGIFYGHIIKDVFIPVDNIHGEVTKRIVQPPQKFFKERRSINDDIIVHLLSGWTVEKLTENLREMNRTKYVIIFAVFEKLQYLFEENSRYKVNEVEELNLYYRPFINFLIKEVDLNAFYFQNNGINFSILYYLSLLKSVNNSILDFLIDEKYEYPINLVRINIQGVLKTCFAFNHQYQVGEPVFYQANQEYPIGFVHDVFTLPLYKLLEFIEYCKAVEIVQVLRMKEIVDRRSSFDNKVILVKIYDGKQSHIALSPNDIPYVGQSVEYLNAQAIVIAEPSAVEIDNIDVNNYYEIK